MEKQVLASMRRSRVIQTMMNVEQRNETMSRFEHERLLVSLFLLTIQRDGKLVLAWVREPAIQIDPHLCRTFRNEKHVGQTLE